LRSFGGLRGDDKKVAIGKSLITVILIEDNKCKIDR
jgi:hypothetical protein